MLKNFYLLPILLAVLICNGCSKENRPADLPALYPVTITFTLDGQPLADALVNLHTEDTAIAKWTIGSYTDAEGKAIIVTHGQFRGAPAGKFKVCVKKTTLPGDEDSRNRERSSEFVVDFSPAQQPPGMPIVTNHVHAEFGKQETTPLEIEVSASKKMLNLTFDVHKP